LLLAYLHFPLSNGYLIVEVLDYSVLPCFFLNYYGELTKQSLGTEHLHDTRHRIVEERHPHGVANGKLSVLFGE